MNKIDKIYLLLGKKIINEGVKYDNTIAIFNHGFELDYNDNYLIEIKERKFNLKYAEEEFNWYMNGDENVKELSKIAKIWNNHHKGDYIVNSNYGVLWRKNNQLENLINLLKMKKDTRRAVITLYDGKDMSKYELDTPCTLNLCFYILNDKLNLSVIMRSNDYWYGLPNDVFCFKKLQHYVAENLKIDVGKYYHFVVNLHIYENKIEKVKEIIKKYKI